MPHGVLTATLRKLRDERGLALPLALGVTVILGSLSAGIFTYVTTNQGAAERARADQRAYGLAEAGLSYAVSTLMNAADPSAADSVPETTVTLTGGSVVYKGILNGNTWTLTGTSTVANPSGPGALPVTREASLQALVTTTTTGDTSPYNYLFIDQPSGCFTLGNTVTLEIALFVRGDLCLENNSLIQSPAVHVFGNVHVNSPQASIGTSSEKIPDFQITGSCYYNGTLTACDNSSVSRVWASEYGTNPPNLTKPTVDLAARYADAQLGPGDNCPALGNFDNDGTMNVSLGEVDLTPSSGYDCYKGPVDDPTAQIKWTPGANPSQTGTLTIKGSIFIDADLTWSNLSLIQYDGLAAIYTSGQLEIENRADLCGVAACDETWDPSVDFLAFVVGSMTSSVSGDIGNNVTFQGSIYAVNDYDQDNNTTVWGPVIARNATLDNSSLFKPLPGDLGVPEGLPLDEMTVTEVELIPGSYAG